MHGILTGKNTPKITAIKCECKEYATIWVKEYATISHPRQAILLHDFVTNNNKREKNRGNG